MKRHAKATIDGTLLGPEAIAELIAMHLYRLGAAQAESVTFVGDGAPWIWDRIEAIVKQAKLEQVPIYEVLDNCHATQHLSSALKALELDEDTRKGLFRNYRTLLRNGHWRQVVEQLNGYGDQDHEENEQLQTPLDYLRRHGEAGRLSYPYFKSLGLPVGSGSIESGIRRVLNLRLKSNATFWKQENAEAMMQLRASILTGRWDAQREEYKRRIRHRPRTAWTWQPRSMRPCQSEATQSTAT